MKKSVVAVSIPLLALIAFLLPERNTQESSKGSPAAGPVAAPSENELQPHAALSVADVPVEPKLDPWTRQLKAAYAADPADVDFQALESFNNWIVSEERDAAKGIVLAKARRVSLNALARLNPEKAWDFFVPLSGRSGLPPEVAALLAEPVSGRADWQPSAVCMDPNLDFSTFYEVEFEGGEPEYAIPVGRLEEMGNPKGIALEGYRLDDITVCAAIPGAEFPEDEGEVAAAPEESAGGLQDALPFLSRPTDNVNEGWRELLYMRTSFDGWNNNQSESAAYNQWRTVNDLLMKNSKGRYQVLVTVTPVIDMQAHAATYGHSPDISTYDVNGLRAAVKDVAEKHYGYDISDYGHQVIYWQNGPGTFGGLASLPGSALSLKTTSNSTAYHELGHNMNFHHSGFLKDQGAEDNYAGSIDLGTHEEYGNPFDHMGHWSTVGGNANFDESHFCAAAARKWNWLHANEIYAFRDSGTFRIHAFDEETVRHDRRYAIEFVRSDGKQYYVSYYKNIAKSPNAHAHENGARLEVLNEPLAGSGIKPVLIDATYWSKHERQDANIPIGWTFQDQEEGVFITPLARAADRSWMDVHVHHGFDPSNRPPVIGSFTASDATPGTSQTVNFSISASDPDGDELAYHWYFDEDGCDWHRDLNQPAASFSWSADSYRSVICTVTDMKGGTVTAQLLITVGSPTDYYITGQVVDKWGNPVGSVPVDNGKPMTDDGNNLISGHRSTLTDTNGIYTLTRLDNGDYSPLARVYGDTGDRINGSNPVNVSGAAVSGVDHVLRTAEIVPSSSSIAEDGGTATFTIRRDPSYTGNHNIPVRVIGKAVLDADFTLTPPPTDGQYNLPSGVPSISITVTGLPDSATEGPEDITLAFELNRQLSLVGSVHGTIWIDDAESALPRVRLAPVGRIVQENGGTELIRATRFGDTAAPLTINLSSTGDAVHGVDFSVVGGLAQTIPAGESSVDIVLQGIDDAETEGREKIQIKLANGSYIKDSQKDPALYIADDDIAEVSIEAIDPVAAEASSDPAVFRFLRTGDLQDALYVEYNALGTALHGTDYDVLPGDITIPAGLAYVDLPVAAFSDAFDDEGETIQLWLTSSETLYHLGTYSGTASIILGELPPDVSPAAGAGDLFYDTFWRYNSDDADSDDGGMSGSLLSSLGTGATYYEGFEGSGLPDSIQVAAAMLRMANGSGMSESGLMHNFIDQSIVDAGGFSVEINVAEINSATPLTDRFAGFAVGLTQAEATAGQDIGTNGSFRGKDGVITGTADFFVELNKENNVVVWRHGVPLATVPVGVEVGTLTAGFACNGFSTSDAVEVTVFLDGVLVDINPGDVHSNSQTFNWQNNNANYIGLSSRASNYVDLDHLAIRTFPMYNAMFAQIAFDAGLSGADAAPDADPDNDGESSYVEWAKGSDMMVGNIPIKFIQLLAASESGFTFEQRRLVDHEALGVNYPVHWSSNLVDWVSFVPVELGATPVAGNGNYEDVELEVGNGITDGKQHLFIRGTVAP
ncbi:hypothetical protein PDESU_01869 [Pontiella desulfatans]|uniref:PKD/Chitinase domain-containing protein n=1 Tax=Pontiella desulfatans TaxID=2750659 RepID=A0A6C2U0C0_PONDE|nr:PKD domain-containing protein [Pontiella desulfatans]VGO13313.1 hypothetical protein PDESU_01869 [Pontiella desulfatans]